MNITKYVFANGERLVEVKPDGSKVFYLDDHLGSSSVLVNQSGQVVDRTSYYPYGDVKTGGTGSKYGYNSKELDGTGLNYYGARYYNPQLKRWTQADTVIQNPYDPQSLNRYSYTNNNPLKYTDPTGHVLVVPFIIAVGLGVGAMISYAYTRGSEATLPGMLAYGGAAAAAPLIATYTASAAAAVGVGQTVAAAIGGFTANAGETLVDNWVDGKQYSTGDLAGNIAGTLVGNTLGRVTDISTKAFRPSSMNQAFYFMQKLDSAVIKTMTLNSFKLYLSDLLGEGANMLTDEEIKKVYEEKQASLSASNTNGGASNFCSQTQVSKKMVTQTTTSRAATSYTSVSQFPPSSNSFRGYSERSGKMGWLYT